MQSNPGNVSSAAPAPAAAPAPSAAPAPAPAYTPNITTGQSGSPYEVWGPGTQYATAMDYARAHNVTFARPVWDAALQTSVTTGSDGYRYKVSTQERLPQ